MENEITIRSIVPAKRAGANTQKGTFMFSQKKPKNTNYYFNIFLTA